MIQGIVLDAHGVMLQPTETNADWLYRYVRQAGGDPDPAAIRRHYIAASLGQLPADEFWRRVGLEPQAEAAYLSSIRPMPGLFEFFELAHRRAVPVWCLSNDVGRWSATLRRQHGLEHHLQGWLISDAVELRKPDPAIYRRFLDQFRLRPEALLFVDDRLDNVEAARTVGFQAVQFKPQEGFAALAETLWPQATVAESK